MLGPEMLKRPRLSRIFYNGKFFDYPLRAMNALFGLGVWNAVRVMTSYVSIRLRPIRPEVSVEDWVSNRFGRRLYETFFKTYTEKVWGVPCNELGAQWAAQRIRGLSLRVAVMDALFGRFKGDKSKVKTLIDQFEYPRLGPGMMWEAFQQELARRGFPVQLESKVRRITHDGGRVTGVEVEQHGVTRHLEVSALVSTMPLRELIRALSPPPRRRARRCKPPPLSGLLHGGAHHQSAGSVPRQLDLRPRPRSQTRSHPEFQELEPQSGARPASDLPRPRVFLLRGRRPVVDEG